MARPRKQKDTAWRNRIVGTGEMTAEELEANPRNPRVHGTRQKGAMTAMLDDVGWVQTIIVNKRTNRIVDGHMRAAIAAQRGPVPVTFIDVSEDEEALIMAAMDPIGAMATTDTAALERLTADLDLSSDLAAMLADLIPVEKDEGVKEPMTVKLRPIETAHVLISVPIDQWDQASAVLAKFDSIPGLTIASTVK